MADKCSGVRFVLAKRHIIGPEGHLGLITSEVYFDAEDQRTIEMLFAHLRGEGMEVEGVYIPRF